MTYEDEMGPDEEVAESRPPLRPIDLDPELANEAAEVVRDFLGDALGMDYVGLQVRYGLVQALHEHGLLRAPFVFGDRVTHVAKDLHPRGVLVLVELSVVDNQRVWVVQPEHAFDREEKYALFESHLRHAPAARDDVSSQ